MKKWVLGFIAALWIGLPIAARAAAIVDLGSDVAVPTIISTTSAVPASSTTISLNHGCRHIVIKTDTGAAALYVRLDGTTATQSNFKIDGGGSLSMDALPLVTQVTIIGAAATGNYSILAW